VITEACAYSEADRCLLILDQLQAAGFADQMRLTGFLRAAEWHSQAGTVIAHRGNLLVVLICEGVLYHSLARLCFRVWTDADTALPDYRPEDYGWPLDSQPIFVALAGLFAALPFSPTPSEFAAVLDDLAHRVHGEEQLRQSLFGRCEGLARTALLAEPVHPLLAGTSTVGGSAGSVAGMAWRGPHRVVAFAASTSAASRGRVAASNGIA